MLSSNETEQPPKNAKRVYKWADLPNTTKPATYCVNSNGIEARTFRAAGHKRQVLEGLLRYPIFAASYCRLSDNVLPLRREDGLEIECQMFQNDPETGRQRYGVYVLKSKVALLKDDEAA